LRRDGPLPRTLAGHQTSLPAAAALAVLFGTLGLFGLAVALWVSRDLESTDPFDGSVKSCTRKWVPGTLNLTRRPRERGKERKHCH
jgi:hypothetical protein